MLLQLNDSTYLIIKNKNIYFHSYLKDDKYLKQ